MKHKPSFRSAADALVDIGRQQLIIEEKMRGLMAYGVVGTDDAVLVAKAAQSAAARMSRDFARVAYVLERMADAEYEEEKSRAAQ